MWCNRQQQAAQCRRCWHLTVERECRQVVLASLCHRCWTYAGSSQCFDSLTSGYMAGYSMARPKHIDFSSELKYCDTKQFSIGNKRDSVISTDLSTNGEVEVTHPSHHHLDDDQDVKVVVVRDRSGLTLALRKLQCCSEHCKHTSKNSCLDRCEHCHQVRWEWREKLKI